MRRMPCRCWYFTIVFALFSVAFTISTHLCRLSPFLLTYVAVSRPCRLSEFYHNRVQTFSPVLQSGSMPSIVYGNMSNLCLLILLCSAFNALILPRICQGPWSTFSRGGGGGLMQTYKHKQTRAVRLHSENFKCMSSEMAINASRTANSSRSL